MKLIPEFGAMGLVGDLDGVAEIALAEIEPKAERDLELVDQDEKPDVDAGVDVLARDHSRQRPGRIEIGVRAAKNGSAIRIIRRTMPKCETPKMARMKIAVASGR